MNCTKLRTFQSPCGIPEIKNFQKHLESKGYQILVYAHMTNKGLIYKGPEKENQIALFYHSRHFDVIVSLKAFLRNVYFCSYVSKGMTTMKTHVQKFL